MGAMLTSTVTAPCNVFGHCGGCATQDLSYAEQLARKQAQLQTWFASWQAVVQPIIPCGDPWRYRNRMDYVFGSGDGGALQLGQHRKGFFNQTVNVDDCWLQSEAANQARNLTRDFFAQRSYAAYHPRTHQGLLRYLIVRQSASTGGLMLNLVLADRSALASADLEAWTSKLRAAVPDLASIYITEQAAKADTAFSTDVQLCWGEKILTETIPLEATKCGAAATANRQFAIDNLQFNISPMAFFQTNTLQARRLYAEILKAAQLSGCETVLDLYCGTGTIAQLLAPQARWVYGVEYVAAAIADAKANAALNNISNATFLTDKVESWLKWNGPELDADLWVLDPPRAGLHPKILRKRLPELEQKPRRILYVSCAPQRLAEDLPLLAADYHVESLLPVDMFPHTPHAEVLAVLSRC